MQLRLVSLGVLLLTVGLVAYSVIPNVQRIPILSREDVIREGFSIPMGESRIVTKNITATPGEQTQLTINISVTAQPGGLSSMKLQVFLRETSDPCVETSPKNYLTNKYVSNQSLSISVNSTGTYCFVFQNEPTENELLTPRKLVSVFVSLERRSEQILVSRNGGANVAGLGVGAFGFLVFAYGVTRKTVIPWE